MNRAKREAGASMVEFSFVAGFIIIVIFSLIEVARYTASMGVLYAAADRAISVAADDYRLLEDQDSQKYKDAVADVQKTFKNTLAGSWIGTGPNSSSSVFLTTDISEIKPVLPTKLSSESSMNEAMLNRPVTITFTAEMVPLIPGSGVIFNPKDSPATNIPIRIFSAAFKEPYKALTMPTAVDCQGRPPSSPDYDTDCACDVDKYWNKGTKACVCYTGDSNNDGVCDCKNSYVFNVEDKTCSKCPKPYPTCSTGKIFSTGICGCECDASLGLKEDSNGGCTDCASTSQVYNNGACACADTAAEQACNSKPSMQWDSWGCNCKCKDGLTDDGNGSCEKCADSNEKYVNGACSCILTNDDCSPTAGGSLDTNTCLCACSGNIEAACANGGGTYNPTTCGCDCGPQSNFVWSYISQYGQCKCPSGRSRLIDGNGKGYCSCPVGQEADGQGGCKCSSPNAILNLTSGACDCTNIPDGGVCPPVGGLNQVFNYKTCACGCGPN
jgi:hypothetical protein